MCCIIVINGIRSYITCIQQQVLSKSLLSCSSKRSAHVLHTLLSLKLHQGGIRPAGCCLLDPGIIELCFKKSSCEYYFMLVGNLYYLYKLYKMYKIVFTTRLFLKHSSILPGSNRVTYHPSLKLIQCFMEERGGAYH